MVVVWPVYRHSKYTYVLICVTSLSSLIGMPSLPTFLDNPEVLDLGHSADVLVLGDPGFSNFKLFFALETVLGFYFVLFFALEMVLGFSFVSFLFEFLPSSVKFHVHIITHMTNNRWRSAGCFLFLFNVYLSYCQGFEIC